MPNIHVLPEHIANKIAAGEVIERPASVVKELVENALDAGAKSIEIDIKHGGKSLIRVSDDGIGMSHDDVTLAFERHATSKISTTEDLFHITSLGFRGEALPSIASVARVTVTTGMAGDAEGTQLTIEGGRKQPARPAPPRRGTLIEVRDLFFNTPARRKFIKGDTTEAGHVLDAVSNLAMAHPRVRFALRSGERITLDVLPSDRVVGRARDVFGDQMADHLLEIDGEADGVRVFGVIGKPFIARANRSYQRFFVNQRWVRSSSLSYALHNGYHGILMHGKFPVAAVFIELNPALVDVNVHPTKQEVRLSNEPELKTMLRNLVVDRLNRTHDLTPSLKPGELTEPSGLAPSAYGRPAADTDLPVKTYVLNHSTSAFQTTHSAPGHTPTATRSRDVLRVSESAVPYHTGAEALDAPLILRDKLRITKLLGQIHHTFVIVETEDGLMIVDQHAAHERIMFEELLRNFRAERPEVQGLLIEETLELPPRHTELLSQSLELLQRVGFDIEPFGEQSFVLRGYPSILGDQNPTAFITDYLDQRDSGQDLTNVDTHDEEIAALIACKRRSVKAHEPLTPAELKALMTRLAACDNPFSCPHGRPTMITQDIGQLERQFKRK